MKASISPGAKDNNEQHSAAAGNMIQAKLTIGNENDAGEREADEAANSVMRMPSENFVQRKCSHCEQEDDIQVQRKEQSSLQTKSDGSSTINSSMSNKIISTQGSGSSMDHATHSFMSSRFGNDFSHVKIHTDSDAVQMSRTLNAKAFTTGSDIYFNEAQYQPHSDTGKQLLAHELVHTMQQTSTAQKKIMRTVDDASVEAEFNKWADDNKKTKDKKHADYPWAVWDFIRPQIVDVAMEPLPKPADKAGLQKWNDNFAKAEIISRWLFTLKATTVDDTIKADADSKGYYLLDSLAKAGFVSQAVAQSGYLEHSNRTLVYNTILSNPSTVSASDLETIISFQCKGVADPASVAIVQTFTNGNDSPLKKLNAEKTKAIFKVLISKYGGNDTVIDAIAEVLMFNPSVRNAVSDAMMTSTIGTPDILFKVLKHKFFIEPEYGASVLQNVMPPGMSPDDYEKKRMKDDMPWVYTYKQKYYVQYLIGLAKGQGITIAAPSALSFAVLKTWLEANTEKIADAAKKKYPTDVNAVLEIYKSIADIFFYHIPHDRDAVPDLEGKISHLKEGEPSQKRFEADCDVFATYAMRLFYNAGFEPVGYIAFIPQGSDASRAAHVAALMRKDGKYYVINNKGILETAITEATAGAKKTDAIKKMRKISFEDAYGDPRPTYLKIYYADAEAKGKMPKLLKDQDSSLERTDL